MGVFPSVVHIANAVNDRKLCSALFSQLVGIMSDRLTQHVNRAGPPDERHGALQSNQC